MGFTAQTEDSLVVVKTETKARSVFSAHNLETI